MQNVTDQRRKKRAPIICAILFIAILAIYLATFIYALIDISYGAVIAVCFVALYGLIILAVIFGILAALRQRLKEIEGGEEEIASKY